jgi:phosphoribosylanthranilate isomerase
VADALPWGVVTVGVFVNENFDFIMSRVKGCGLAMVQLHGKESPELVGKLKGEGVGVIKGLFVDGAPGLENAGKYPADGFSGGVFQRSLARRQRHGMGLGGGQGLRIGNWPLVLAGGLSPENVTEAISAALPAAVDLSSSVETEPGRKDPIGSPD